MRLDQRQRLAEVVGDEQHGLALALPDLEQGLVHLELGVGVERAERLVHQEDLGLHDERAHQRHALAHAARQRAREAPAEAGEAGHLDRRARPSPARSAFGTPAISSP